MYTKTHTEKPGAKKKYFSVFGFCLKKGKKEGLRAQRKCVSFTGANLLFIKMLPDLNKSFYLSSNKGNIVYIIIFENVCVSESE